MTGLGLKVEGLGLSVSGFRVCPAEANQQRSQTHSVRLQADPGSLVEEARRVSGLGFRI